MVWVGSLTSHRRCKFSPSLQVQWEEETDLEWILILGNAHPYKGNVFLVEKMGVHEIGIFSRQGHLIDRTYKKYWFTDFHFIWKAGRRRHFKHVGLLPKPEPGWSQELETPSRSLLGKQEPYCFSHHLSSGSWTSSTEARTPSGPSSMGAGRPQTPNACLTSFHFHGMEESTQVWFVQPENLFTPKSAYSTVFLWAWLVCWTDLGSLCEVHAKISVLLYY